MRERASANSPLALLKDVSRSFYYTLRILPAKVRPQIGLAYLLARATDTVADTTQLPVEERLAALHALRERILGHGGEIEFLFEGKASGQAAERVLLERVEEAIQLLARFESADRELVRKVLSTITSGQELDLKRFARAQPGEVIALKNADELEDYTYRVAGCVGEFWTNICHRHLFPGLDMAALDMVGRGIRFGKGLQLINILRDLASDLRGGRCYLPADELAKAGLRPTDLLDLKAARQLSPVYVHWVSKARQYLCDGWDYTNALPVSGWRVRLACAWPILIGQRTLDRLECASAMNPLIRIKISRRELRGIFAKSVITYPVPWLWKRQMPCSSRSEASA